MATAAGIVCVIVHSRVPQSRFGVCHSGVSTSHRVCLPSEETHAANQTWSGLDPVLHLRNVAPLLGPGPRTQGQWDLHVL